MCVIFRVLFFPWFLLYSWPVACMFLIFENESEFLNIYIMAGVCYLGSVCLKMFLNSTSLS